MNDSLTLSERGLELLKHSEGFRNFAYKDVAGFLTIGYGHLIKPNESFPLGVTAEKAAEILRSDVSTAEQAVKTRVSVPLRQGQFDALVDFVFNLGEKQLKDSTLLRLLNQGDYAGARDQFSRWVLAGGKPQPGLIKRRAAEQELWNS